VGATATSGATSLREGRPGTLDREIADWVRAERSSSEAVFDRWRRARRQALAALRGVDPGVRLAWVTNSVSPATLATTRLAEHWAHGLDITGPLAIRYEDTERLRHVAWLGHRTLPYAFGLAGLPPAEVCCDLTGPGGQRWLFGRPDAPSGLSGPAADFCRVGARRLAPDDARLVARGPYGDQARRLLRTYAA
jgi:uncharacterized protein (TIGR03084 family)